MLIGLTQQIYTTVTNRLYTTVVYICWDSPISNIHHRWYILLIGLTQQIYTTVTNRLYTTVVYICWDSPIIKYISSMIYIAYWAKKELIQSLHFRLVHTSCVIEWYILLIGLTQQIYTTVTKRFIQSLHSRSLLVLHHFCLHTDIV